MNFKSSQCAIFKLEGIGRKRRRHQLIVFEAQSASGPNVLSVVLGFLMLDAIHLLVLDVSAVSKSTTLVTVTEFNHSLMHVSNIQQSRCP